MNQRIGIDIGNVLTERDTDLRPFGKDYLNVSPCEGAFIAVSRLAKLFGNNNVFIISKCSLQNQVLSKDWLIKKGFFDITKVPTENLYFCERRIQKRDIAEKYHLNFFVDDRFSVLRHLEDLVSMKGLFLFNPFQEELDLFEREYNGKKIVVVETWQQVIDNIIAVR